jgi:hypothetical protein
LAVLDGSWHFFKLESFDDTSLELNQVVEPLSLASLSFLTASAVEEVSLLARGSSLVLLASVSKTPTREIVLLLWDLQYSVLLSSQSLPIPPQTSKENEHISLKLVSASSASQTVLIVSPSSKKPLSKGSNLKSSVIAVPLTVPAHSTIANAMGRATAGAPWLASSGASGQIESNNAGVPESSSFSTRQKKLLIEMRKAMEQNRPQAANTAFFDWEKKEGNAKGSSSEKSGEVSCFSTLLILF